MQGEVHAGKESNVDCLSLVNASVILHVEADRREEAVLPKIQAAGDFHIATARGLDISVPVAGVEVVVYEEVGIAPGVVVKAFKSSGDVLAVRAEVVENLEIRLGFGGKDGKQGRTHCGENE